jgi:hypothetical protein
MNELWIGMSQVKTYFLVSANGGIPSMAACPRLSGWNRKPTFLLLASLVHHSTQQLLEILGLL